MTKFVSFARNMEDVLLRRALRDIDHGFYIDLGAAEADMKLGHQRFLRSRLERHQYWHGPAWHRTAGAAAEGCEPAGRSDCRGMSFAPIDPEKRCGRRGLEAACSTGQAVHFLKVDADRISEGMIENGGLTELRPWIVLLSSAVAADARIARLDAFERPLLAGGYARVYSDGFQPLLPFSGRAASEGAASRRRPTRRTISSHAGRKSWRTSFSGSGPSLTRLRHQSGKWSGFTASCWNSRTRP